MITCWINNGLIYLLLGESKYCVDCGSIIADEIKV